MEPDGARHTLAGVVPVETRNYPIQKGAGVRSPGAATGFQLICYLVARSSAMPQLYPNIRYEKFRRRLK
jgi:hypothetical protein